MHLCTNSVSRRARCPLDKPAKQFCRLERTRSKAHFTKKRHNPCCVFYQHVCSERAVLCVICEQKSCATGVAVRATSVLRARVRTYTLLEGEDYEEGGDGR